MNAYFRLGTAAFALGLSLAGPQALGVAWADRGDDGSSAGATHAGPARGTPKTTTDGPSHTARGPHSTAPETIGAAQAVAAASAVEEPPAAEPPIEPPIAAVEPTMSEPLIAVDPDPTETPLIAVDPAPAEPDATAEHDADAKPDSSAGGVDADNATESDGTGQPEVTTDADVAATPKDESPADSTAASDGDDSEVVALPVVVMPGRGGPIPLPWWRSATGTITDTGFETGPLAVTDPSDTTDLVQPYSGTSGPSTVYTMTADNTATSDALPTLYVTTDSPTTGSTSTAISGPVTASAGQFLTAVRTGVANFFDEISSWLTTLPASPFTEFLSGVLLLVRRGLVPLGIPMTTVVADGGTSEGTTVAVDNPSMSGRNDITPDVSQYWQGPVGLPTYDKSEIEAYSCVDGDVACNAAPDIPKPNGPWDGRGNNA